MEKPYFTRKILKNGRITALSNKLEGYYCLVIPLKIKTLKQKDSFKSSCRDATEYCKFSFLGDSCRIYTDGFTEHIKPLIPIIKRSVLNDCIKNPSKLLKEVENERKNE